MRTSDNFFDKIAEKESSFLSRQNPNDSYKEVNRLGYLGKYQMGEEALDDAKYYVSKDGTGKNDWIGVWKGKDGVYSKEDFLNNPQAQENAIRAFYDRNWEYIQAKNLDSYVGKSINGTVLTESALVAGAHLVGIKNLTLYLTSEGAYIPKDGNKVPITTYMSALADYELPYRARSNYIPIPELKPEAPTPLQADNVTSLIPSQPIEERDYSTLVHNALASYHGRFNAEQLEDWKQGLLESTSEQGKQLTVEQIHRALKMAEEDGVREIREAIATLPLTQTEKDALFAAYMQLDGMPDSEVATILAYKEHREAVLQYEAENERNNDPLHNITAEELAADKAQLDALEAELARVRLEEQRLAVEEQKLMSLAAAEEEAERQAREEVAANQERYQEELAAAREEFTDCQDRVAEAYAISDNYYASMPEEEVEQSNDHVQEEQHRQAYWQDQVTRSQEQENQLV